MARVLVGFVAARTRTIDGMVTALLFYDVPRSQVIEGLLADLIPVPVFGPGLEFNIPCFGCLLRSCAFLLGGLFRYSTVAS